MPVERLSTGQSHPAETRLLKKWLGMIIKPGEDDYLEHQSDTGFLSVLLGISIIALLTSLYNLASGNLPFWGKSPGVAGNFILVFLCFVIGFYIVNIILYFLMKIFGGSGNYVDQCSMLSLLITPLGIILHIFLWVILLSGLEWNAIFNPLSLSGILGVLFIFFVIYSLILVLLGLRTVHQTKATNALNALLVMATLYFTGLVSSMFINQQETLITRIWFFIAQQWEGEYLQESLLGHLWLVLFSVVIAVIIGVITGVLITMPVHKPKAIHLLFFIPLVIFFILWAASSGLLGEETAAQIESSVRTWERSLKGHSGFFAEFLVIIGAILRKPAAIGIIGIFLTVFFYILFLVGEKASEITLYTAGIILTIPSIALFGVLIKPLGIGVFNAAFALILYAQLPILRNTYTGIKEIQPEIIEAGRGMGMTEFQLLIDVKLPLAVPVIMTGLRVSTVMLVGIAAIAAYIGTNTMGDYIFAGIQRAQEIRYITGAIVVAILALIVDYILGMIQNQLTPVEFKERRNNG